MEQELKIKINGDIDGLKKAVEESSKELDSLVNSHKRVTDGLKSLNDVSLQYEKTLKDLSQDLKAGNISQEEFAKESEKVKQALSDNRLEIAAYHREQDRLSKQIQRASAALESKQSSTAQDTAATESNTDATKQNTNELKKSDAALIRHVYNQRAALSATNNLTRSFTAMSVGGKTAAFNIGVAARQLATLSISAATASGGMSALVASMMGPGGIAIAASAAVTAITTYIASKISAKKATDDATSANKNYIETLKGVERTQADGEVAAQRDLTNLRLLYEATQNLTLPMEARRKAADELIRQYPRQFEGMSREAILAGQAASAYNQLTASITATAMAAANLDRIRDNSNKILENRLRIVKLQNEANELGLRIERERANIIAVGAAGPSGVDASAMQQQATISQLESQRRDILEEINKLGKESGEINGENAQLQAEYNAQISKGADLSGRLNTSLDKGVKARKTEADKLAEDLIKNENRVQVAIREGRDKEIEQARIRYEELYQRAKENSEAIIQIANQEAEEIAAINRKWDEKDLERYRKKVNERLEELKRQNAVIDKENEQAREKQRRETEKALLELERMQQRYARALGRELSQAFDGFLSHGESIFKSLGDAFKRMIVRMIADAAALKMIQFFSAAARGGGLLGTIGGIVGSIVKGMGGGLMSARSMSFPVSSMMASMGSMNRSGFSPGNLSVSPQAMSVVVKGEISNNVIKISNDRATRFNGRFNGGQ